MGRNITTYVGATNIISSLGFSTAENTANVSAGVSGIGRYSDDIIAAGIDRNRLAGLAAQHSLEDHMPLEQLMILSITDVVQQSGVDLCRSESVLIFSTTKGNVDLLAGNNDLADERVYLWRMAERVAGYFRAAVRPIVISNACISGVSAIIVASRLIREGAYKNIVVVGGDILTDFVISGFSAFKSLSAEPCRPFDGRRDGLTLGEAAASMLITSEQVLSSGIVVEGGAITNDANHISGPSRTGEPLAGAIMQAMDESGLQASDITFVNTHGTATLFNDEMESKAIHLCGLQDVPVTGLKSYFGHTLGAAGIVEAIMCTEQLKSGVLFGTKGFESLGVPCPIRVSADHGAVAMARCMKSASGFGGCNAAVVLALEELAGGRKNTVDQTINKAVTHRCKVVAKSVVSGGRVVVNDQVVLSSEGTFAEFIRAAFKALDRPDMKFYKMDDLCKLGYLTAGYLLEKQSYGPGELAIIMANRSSSLDTDIKHQDILNRHTEEGPSPAVFVYTLPNVVAGEICIRHKIQGENTFFIDDHMPEEFMQNYARTILARDGYRGVILGWCEKIGERYDSQMTLIEKQ